MSVPALELGQYSRSEHDTGHAVKSGSVGRSISWWDRATDCTIVLAEPSAEPDLWDGYIDGALRSYRKHGVERALDPEAIASPAATTLFLVAINDLGRIVAGVRAQGPHTAAEDSHALVEWDNQPAQPALRKMIADRIPFGVVEIKTAWTSDDAGRGLTAVLARMPLHTTLALGAKFAMATAAAHVLDKWRSSGGVVAAKIPATPYPDERYHTKIMWWDRGRYARYADPQQNSTIAAETRHVLMMACDNNSGYPTARSGV